MKTTLSYIEMEIRPWHIKQGYIPDFFIEYWKKNHDGKDPVVEYENKERGINLGILQLIVSCIVFLLAAFVTISEVFLSSNHEQNSGWILLVGSVGMFISIIPFFCYGLKSRDNVIDPDFFRDLSSLFNIFKIDRTNRGIGLLNYGIFWACIEDSLRKKAKQVDEAVGFDQVGIREEFNQMHKIALKWGLCHESHASYFPQKK